MRTVETTVQPDEDGLLRLSIPVDDADRSYHVLVVIDDQQTRAPATEWPEGFIEATAGAWVGELERPPQV